MSGECIRDEKGYIHVIAEEIDNLDIKFTCPFCYTRYKKDGTPTKNAKNSIHTHGSGNNFNNRVEYRTPHCGGANSNPDYEFAIHITNNTKKYTRYNV